MQLQNSSVLITGGAGGIGRSLAAGLLSSVSKVVVIDKTAELLNGIPDHVKLSKFAADLTDYVQAERAVESAMQNAEVNVLVNNAGLIHNEPMLNLLSRDRMHQVDSWRKVVDINLNSVFYVTRVFVDQLVRRKSPGLIINISSISAQGNAGQSAYSATKAAVEALTHTWAKELGMFKIRATCIAPGFFDTESTRANLSEQMISRWQRSVPLGRLGQMDELISAVTFLIENEYYNGKVLSLDGGLTI